MDLPSLQFLILHAYEEVLETSHCVINVLFVVFWVFVMNCENQEQL